MVLFNVLLFVASVLILFYIVRYRIHIHVSYQPVSRKRATATLRPLQAAIPSARAKTLRESFQPAFAPRLKQQGEPAQSLRLSPSGSGVSALRRSPLQEELKSALVNLGCKPKQADEAARKAAEQPGDFDARLRFAINEAA